MFSKDKSVRLKQIESALKYNSKLTAKGKQTLEKMRAELLAEGINTNKTKKAVKKNEKKNKFGVKKGDVFVSSWGYDATFHDFYEVTDILGETRVKVRELSKSPGKSEGYGSLDWTVRPDKNSYTDTPEMVRNVNKSSYFADEKDKKEGCYIRDKYKHHNAYYTKSPFNVDWHEDNYH